MAEILAVVDYVEIIPVLQLFKSKYLTQAASFAFITQIVRSHSKTMLAPREEGIKMLKNIGCLGFEWPQLEPDYILIYKLKAVWIYPVNIWPTLGIKRPSPFT